MTPLIPSKSKLSSLVSLVALAAATLYTPVASALPAIGFDPTGTGTYSTYADLWTMQTDSALSVGFVPITSGGFNCVTGVGGCSAYNTSLTAQARVDSMSSNGSKVLNTPLPTANPGWELTKVLKIQETVIIQSPTNATFIAGPTQPDIDSSTAGNQQLMIFFDPFGTGDASQAQPGNGTGTVKNYGAGSTSSGSDGVLILSAHLVSADSSFGVGLSSSPPTTGTGSFDLRFMIDYVNTSYLDIATNSIFGDKLTGTVNIPTLYTPNQMWDGTATNTGLLLKVDSSETFFQTPEPGSLALVGFGLLGAGYVGRRRARR